VVRGLLSRLNNVLDRKTGKYYHSPETMKKGETMKKTAVLLAVLSLACTHAVSAATIKLPSDAKALSGGVAEIPVSIESAAGVAGFQLTINYNGRILQLIEALPGDLTANWLIAANRLSDNSLRVLGVDMSLQGISVTSGTLCILRFKVTGDPGSSTYLNFESQYCIIADESGGKIDSSFIDGRFEVESVTKPASISGTVTYQGNKTGDVYVALFSSNNISVEPVVAVKISSRAGTYDYQLDNVTPGVYYLHAGMDTNNDDKIEPLTEPVGAYQGNPLSLQEGQSVTANIELVDPVEKEIAIADSSGAPGSEVSVPIIINEAAGIANFEFKIWNWDSSILEFVRAEKGDLLGDDWVIQKEEILSGGVRIIAMGVTTTLNGSGSLAKLIFKPNSNAQVGQQTTIEFDTNNCSLYDASGKPVPNVDYRNGKFTVVSGFVYHPADTNKDGKIVLGEMVAYATAWKKGTEWPEGPNPIPMSYMVRAAYLWKGGETYDYDKNQQPPACWIRKTE